MLKTLASQIKEFKKDSILTPLFMILEVIMETLIPIMMASIIDNGVEAGDMNHIYKMGALMVGAAVVSLFAGIMGGKYGARASAGFARNLRQKMFERIQGYSFANIDKYSTAGLVTRLTTDVSNIQNAYQMILRMFTRAPASLIFAMTMAFLINAKLASVYLIAVIFLSILLALGLTKASKYFMTVFKKYDDLNASVQENVSAIRVVKAFVREDHENSKFKKASENVYKLFLKAENITILASPVMQITVYTCILVISWLGAKMIVQDSMTTGQLMSLLTYCMNILMSLMMLSMIFVMATMSFASAERIAEVINEDPSIKNPEKPDYDIPDGSIKKYDLEKLRDNVAVVLQKNVLFSGTILDNLRWGKADATKEECEEVCRLACVDDFVEKLPEGYDTYIEQGGTNVSGGQRQRLCIARALLKKPKILILDDSTSAVDTATDARIRKAFKEEIPDTTKIIIAQRISSVQNADRIIVMDDGKINGFDTHENLIKTNEIYREVYESQTGANGDFDENGGEN